MAGTATLSLSGRTALRCSRASAPFVVLKATCEDLRGWGIVRARACASAPRGLRRELRSGANWPPRRGASEAPGSTWGPHSPAWGHSVFDSVALRGRLPSLGVSEQGIPTLCHLSRTALVSDAQGGREGESVGEKTPGVYPRWPSRRHSAKSCGPVYGKGCAPCAATPVSHPFRRKIDEPSTRIRVARIVKTPGHARTEQPKKNKLGLACKRGGHPPI